MNTKRLFTPGPLTTSQTVKQAMLTDLGSRDDKFIELIMSIRQQLLDLAMVKKGDYEAVIMQGSGTFGIEAVMNTAIPRTGKNLILINGAYGHRIKTICSRLSIPVCEQVWPENERVDPDKVDSILSSDPSITHVSVVHCETTTGIMNPIDDIGIIVKKHNKEYIVDAMSSFGAYPINLQTQFIDWLVSSSNKCIEGVPGFSFILVKSDLLKSKKGNSSSLSLDVEDQWSVLERTGQFRFTPPTHVLLAFHQALHELNLEGGVDGRAARYMANHNLLLSGMEQIGFKSYLAPELRGYIITTFKYPDHPNFNFENFYRQLSERGYVIYPGKLTYEDCFRIGNIGQLHQEDIQGLLVAIQDVLASMTIILT